MANKRRKLPMQPKNIINFLRKTKKAMSCKEIAEYGDRIPGTFKNPGNSNRNLKSVHACIKYYPDKIFYLSKKRHKQINPLAPDTGAALLKEWEGSLIDFPVNIKTNFTNTGKLKMNIMPKLDSVIEGDNLDTMRKMPDKCINLVILDPPYNSDSNYSDKDGKYFFKDKWDASDIRDDELKFIEKNCLGAFKIINFAFDEVKSISTKAYLSFMTMRLLEIHRLLKDDGSVYLHVDHHAGHYLKLIMDVIFGIEQFRNEIVWCYTGAGSPNMQQFNRKHDTIFWYSKGDTWTFNGDDVRIEHEDGGPHSGGFTSETDNGIDKEKSDMYSERGKIPETWWAQKKGNGFCSVVRSKNQNTGYPTQKPLALLKRIIMASSNEGDIVFDPFCGSGSTLVASAELKRKFIGCELETSAVELVKERLKNATLPLEVASSFFEIDDEYK